MTTRNKLIEDFQTKIRKIFKESVEDTEAPIVPAPETAAPPEGGALPGGEALEEPKVTLTVSLLKSLLNWAHGEEEGEEEGEELPNEEGSEASPEVPPTLAEAEAVDPTTPPSEPIEGEGEEDAGVESVEIDALVSKVEELGKEKEVLTDEDFGTIVAAAEATEGEGELGGTDDLSGVLDGSDDGATDAIEKEINEEIGKVIPTGAKFKNEGNKGIGK
jgi:hypothetical protein